MCFFEPSPLGEQSLRLLSFPQQLLRHADEIWVPSNFNIAVLQQAHPRFQPIIADESPESLAPGAIPVLRVPESIDLSVYRPNAPAMQLSEITGLTAAKEQCRSQPDAFTDPFVVLSVFEWTSRKGMQAQSKQLRWPLSPCPTPL